MVVYTARAHNDYRDVLPYTVIFENTETSLNSSANLRKTGKQVKVTGSGFQLEKFLRGRRKRV